jgi:hypothetical protein
MIHTKTSFLKETLIDDDVGRSPQNKSGPPVNHGRAARNSNIGYFIRISFFTELNVPEPSWFRASIR